MTPELLVPSGVLTQVGGDWFASNELANATSPARRLPSAELARTRAR